MLLAELSVVTSTKVNRFPYDSAMANILRQESKRDHCKNSKGATKHLT